MVKLKYNTNNRSFNFKTKEANNVQIGSCIKIKNSKKIFQIVGLNHKRNICWVREWPLKNSIYSTFEVSVNKILIPIICRFEKQEDDKSVNV